MRLRRYPTCSSVADGDTLDAWQTWGRMLVILGVALVVIGGIVMLLGRTGLALGRLPGDFVYRGKNGNFYFPLASAF